MPEKQGPWVDSYECLVHLVWTYLVFFSLKVDRENKKGIFKKMLLHDDQ